MTNEEHTTTEEIVLTPALINTLAECVGEVAKGLKVSRTEIVAALGYLTGVYSAREAIIVRVPAPPGVAPDGLECLAIGYHSELRKLRAGRFAGSA